MDFAEFNFAYPFVLIAAVLPLGLWLLARKQVATFHYLEQFASAHLLPHLLLNATEPRRRFGLWYWTAIWLLGVFALAGPRWDYIEQEVFRPRASLLVLLDLSESMRVRDLSGAQSRFDRALQEVEDLLSEQADIDIGLVGFAGIPHLIAPLSDDYNTLKHLLYSLDIDLAPVQGSRLGLAVEQSITWLQSEQTSGQHILLISDGDFTEDDFQAGLAEVKQVPAQFHVLGVGSSQGDLIPLDENTWQRDEKGEVVISKLREDLLQQLAAAGGGLYQRATVYTQESELLLARVRASVAVDPLQSSQQKLWHERFYIPLALMMLLLLPWFRQREAMST